MSQLTTCKQLQWDSARCTHGPLTVLALRLRPQFAPEKAAEFYAEHKGKGFYERLVAFMSR